MSKFQIIVLAVLAAVILIAVLMFSGILPGFKNNPLGKESDLVLWGPFPKEKMSVFLNAINEQNRDVFKISYIEKSPESYGSEIINAMAAGNAPDLWIISQDMLYSFGDKIQGISFQSLPERAFKDMFADSAEIFMNKEQQMVMAAPVLVDPIVMYWNRDLFSSSNIAKKPEFWTDFLSDAEILTKKDSAGNISQSGAAMGGYRNISNAKDIFSMLVLQTGNKIAERGERGYEIVWNETTGGLSPAENALMFFADFSNPKKSNYSWNMSLPNSLDMFSSGLLATYFGYAGEFNKIKEKNPHLNFDAAEVPQIKDGRIKAAFGKVYGLAISKNSQSKTGAFFAITKMIEKDNAKILADALYMAPARRDILSEGSADSALSVFYKSAVMARSWLEPDMEQVSGIFKNMIESAATGLARPGEAVNAATKTLQELYK